MSSDDRERPPRQDPPGPDRRRLDDVFGDVLPETTSDEREQAARPAEADDWFLENRPPHHG
ncbi:hypothetical protein B0I33_102168 [Prauserella shujinwangii]|uniref:Uncharacterized protein n=1 Tax=Prauserella shujinwangii TaxID=1453103 RepID=A0A2T0M0E0_9PSEU|nr:hypothetical protein [Prauserella shujinwangii]PRX50051.1 hypothetical protein B0I33_102168 [Prauserella shujinwangii]